MKPTKNHEGTWMRLCKILSHPIGPHHHYANGAFSKYHELGECLPTCAEPIYTCIAWGGELPPTNLPGLAELLRANGVSEENISSTIILPVPTAEPEWVTRTEDRWDDVISKLREGDDVETRRRYEGYAYTMRGVLWKEIYSLCAGSSTVRYGNGEINGNIEAIRVWSSGDPLGDATLCHDNDGTLWERRPGEQWRSPLSKTRPDSVGLVRDFGPITILVPGEVVAR